MSFIKSQDKQLGKVERLITILKIYHDHRNESRQLKYILKIQLSKTRLVILIETLIQVLRGEKNNKTTFKKYIGQALALKK